MDPFVAVAMQKIAKLDPLLIMTFARFPEAAPWTMPERRALIGILIPNVCDVVYGPAERAETSPAAVPRLEIAAATSKPSTSGGRYYVDHDGFAMCDGQPLSIEELKPGTILHDERTGMEQGDIGAILWRDIGTTKRGLPAGVTLVATAPEHRPTPSEMDQ
jgi:hypothetical protein